MVLGVTAHYTRVLHYMMMGQLIPTRHHICYHSFYDRYPLTD